MRKLEKVGEVFYIFAHTGHTDGNWESRFIPVKGKLVVLPSLPEELAGVEFFLHRDSQNSDYWKVSEAVTGYSVGSIYAKTRKGTMEQAAKKVNDSPQTVLKCREEVIRLGRVSPRYRVVEEQEEE